MLRGIRIERRSPSGRGDLEGFPIRDRWREMMLFSRRPYWRWRKALGAFDRGWSRIYR
ncbi:hypothetical protein [Azospirillum sp. sgz302134]